jgi:circadian clock protein KaiC
MTGVNGMEPMGRIATGNRELDRILGGGFPAQSLNIVMGHPGTGKTVFVEQLLFHNARDDRPALFLTTLSEPLAKVVTYLQRFGFYDPNAMGSAVVYDDVGADLAETGPDAVIDRLKTAIREIGPKIIVIDSFKAIQDLTETPSRMRRFTSELGGLLGAYDTTTFLVGEYSIEDVPRSPEFAVADGIIEFSRRATAARDERFLRVLKLRGSSYLEGHHAFRITADGLEVFPRLVSPAIPTDYEAVDDRLVSGVVGLDDMLAGGLRRGSGVLAMGAAGAGKTTLGVTFAAAGVQVGEPALYINLQENPIQLAHAIRGLGLDLAQLRRDGLHLMYASPVELQIDSLVVAIFRMVAEKGIRRVIIDSVDELALSARDMSRFHDFAYALLQQLAAMDVTTLLTMESPANRAPRDGDPRLLSLADAILELGIHFDGKPQRYLRIVKARGINHDLAEREMIIQAGGLRIANGKPA